VYQFTKRLQLLEDEAGLELLGVGGLNPPPQFMFTDAHFGVKISFKFQSLGKISNISTDDPQFF